MDKERSDKWLFLTVLGGAFFVGASGGSGDHLHPLCSGECITTNIGEKYWVHNDEHDTHDPTAHGELPPVVSGFAHYLIPAEGVHLIGSFGLP
ncbi:MAG: hypothetical protein IPO56_08190 [Flavobacteriales bacterium]|nr:hypothetical protein [Flavobacteriales bacterium]